MNLRKTPPAEAEVEDTAAASTSTGTKGRPTPKQRESAGTRGPVTAPKTRKEAVARQKQLAKERTARPKAAARTAGPSSAAERREALRRGDPDVLPRRDQGKTRKLARDYVDSHRMLSNYMLWLFPIMVAGAFVPLLSLVTLVVFFALLVEWYTTGRRIRALAAERYGKAEGSALAVGFYSGSRAYLPRKWRLPAPQVNRGDPI